MKTESCVILTETRKGCGVLTRYRLIETFDAFLGTAVFSVLLTTEYGGTVTEDFVCDLSRDPDEAARFFRRIVEYRATATHLRELAEDFLCESAEI